MTSASVRIWAGAARGLGEATPGVATREQRREQDATNPRVGEGAHPAPVSGHCLAASVYTAPRRSPVKDGLGTHARDAARIASFLAASERRDGP